MPDTMQKLAIPQHPGLVEALGNLAIAHTHLELILRYAVKTVAGLSIEEALDATNRESISDVRKRLRSLFLEKKPTPSEVSKLDSLLGATRRLSEKRNGFLHSAWSETEAGEAVLKGEDYRWGAAPTKEQVDNVTTEILELVGKINDARLGGFIHEVVVKNGTKQEVTLSAAPGGAVYVSAPPLR